jgi:hypothetical protein
MKREIMGTKRKTDMNASGFRLRNLEMFEKPLKERLVILGVI